MPWVSRKPNKITFAANCCRQRWHLEFNSILVTNFRFFSQETKFILVTMNLSIGKALASLLVGGQVVSGHTFQKGHICATVDDTRSMNKCYFLTPQSIK